MLRRLIALLWSRKEVMMANKMVVCNLFLPVLMVLLYQLMFKGKEGSEQMILFMVLPMVPNMVGYALPTLVSEEAEKNNQKSLWLAGVKGWEYIVTSLLVPLGVSLVYLVVLPIYLGVPWSDLGWAYGPVLCLTTLILLNIYLMLALWVDNQARASILAMPIMLLGSFLPMFALLDPKFEQVISLTPMGAFSQYSMDLADFSFSQGSFLALVVWLVLSVLGLLWIARHKKLISR